jgi:heme exporter protein D
MITSASQWVYIWSAYGLVALVVAGLVAWVCMEGRRLNGLMRELEARGVRRRSAGD